MAFMANVIYSKRCIGYSTNAKHMRQLSTAAFSQNTTPSSAELE